MTPTPASNAAAELLTLGHRIRHFRTRRGLTLDDLGERVGLAASQLSLIENGKREPKLSVLQELTTALGVDLTDLLSKEAPNPAQRWRSSWTASSAVPSTAS